MKRFTLDDHPKIGSGFSAPEGYFDMFEDSVLQQLKQEPKVIRLFDWSNIPKAAAVLLLALMVPLYTLYNSPVKSADTASMEAYLQYGTNISQYELASLLDDADLENLESEIPIEDAAIEDILSNADIEEYLIN